MAGDVLTAQAGVRVGAGVVAVEAEQRSIRAPRGVQLLGLVSQSEFLTNLGIAEALAPPTGGNVNLEEYYARRRTVSELLDPAALGRIRVLLQTKAVAAPHLTGLEGPRNA